MVWAGYAGDKSCSSPVSRTDSTKWSCLIIVEGPVILLTGLDLMKAAVLQVVSVVKRGDLCGN